VPGGARALDVLQFIAIEKEHQEGYNRDLFAYPDDLDGDGCDTRDEVLVRDSLSPAQLDGNGCTAVAGDWYSAYDDATWTRPGEVEIDHVVALKEAWDSGAWAWDAGRQRQFGNDLDDVRTLRVVTAGLNSSKGDADPSNWIPPNDAAVCGYLADWIAIKVRWTLSMDESEHGRIRNLLTDRCPDQMIAPWLDAPPVTPPTTVPPTTVPPTTVPPTTVAPTTIATTPPPTQAPQPFIPPVVTAPPSADCDPSYPDFCLPPSSADTLNCADVPYTDFRVLPPDPHGFDGNNDGEGCES
jgi:hypothetical protein